jgi:uroporphyrinogen-III synthase
MNPLAGQRIVITRAADQAPATAAMVAATGAIPVVVPLIEIVDEPGGMAELSSIDLPSFDWIAVTSPNGARRVASRLHAGEHGPLIAAVGGTTAAALSRCDLSGATQSAQGLLSVFADGPGRVLVIQAVDAAPTLADGLADRGWTVVTVRPYRTVSVAPSAAQRREALDADAVVFASGSAALAWVEAFGTVTPPIVVAIGNQTSAAAQRVGLKISATSTDHSVKGMLATLSRYLSSAN